MPILVALAASIASVSGPPSPSTASSDQARAVHTVDDATESLQRDAARHRPARGDGAAGARPQGNPGEWITPDDYPPAALRISASGNTRFRLDIDASGRVAACTVTQPSGNADLDTATCATLTKRATFVPARDRKGRAIASTYSSSVNWQIPVDGPASSPCLLATPSLPSDIGVAGVQTCP